MRDEQLERSIQYRADFNPDPIRKMLGLDGAEAGKMPDHEKLRLANMLHRREYLSAEDIKKLGLVVRPADQSGSRNK